MSSVPGLQRGIPRGAASAAIDTAETRSTLDHATTRGLFIVTSTAQRDVGLSIGRTDAFIVAPLAGEVSTRAGRRGTRYATYLITTPQRPFVHGTPLQQSAVTVQI